MGEHLYTFIDPPNPKHLKQIQWVLENDGVLAVPADTSWMLCCKPNSKKAIQKIRQLKPLRDKDKPFSVVCDSISMASDMAAINGQAFRLLNRICPGPYTVLLKSGRLLPKLLKNKRQVVGIRIPNAPLILEIVRQMETPLLATSIPTDANGEVLRMGFAIHEEYSHGIDLVVDLGEELPGTSTTIIDMTQGSVDIVREGAGDISIL